MGEDAHGAEAGRVRGDAKATVDGRSLDGNSVECVLVATSFDSSCNEDTDCVPVSFGNACQACFQCHLNGWDTTSAINVSDLAKYVAAVNAAAPEAGTGCACGTGGGGSGYEGMAAYCTTTGTCVAGQRVDGG